MSPFLWLWHPSDFLLCRRFLQLLDSRCEWRTFWRWPGRGGMEIVRLAQDELLERDDINPLLARRRVKLRDVEEADLVKADGTVGSITESFGR